METLQKAKVVTVYGNPLARLGLREQAEMLEVIKDFGKLQYCKVRMADSGRICTLFVNTLQP